MGRRRKKRRTVKEDEGREDEGRERGGKGEGEWIKGSGKGDGDRGEEKTEGEKVKGRGKKGKEGETRNVSKVYGCPPPRALGKLLAYIKPCYIHRHFHIKLQQTTIGRLGTEFKIAQYSYRYI